jgi:hypothetical protein
MGDDGMSKLFSYVCPSCGGHLDTDDSRKLMICRSCGNTYDYDYFSGENLLKAADKALAHNFSAAKDMYSFMLDKEPSNVKALTGLLLANNDAGRLYDITQKIKDGTFSAAGFDLVKYKDTADPEVLAFFEKTDRILALYKEYIALKKDLKRLEAEKKDSEPEVSEPGGGLFSYASEKTLKTTVVVASAVFVILLTAAILSGFNGPAQALSTAVLVIAMIVTGIIILAALIQLRDNKKAAEEPAMQEPDETEKNRLEIERVIGEINDVFKEISSLS